MTEGRIAASCEHFLQYKGEGNLKSFTLVHGCFSACVSKEARKRKALSCLCFICGRSGPQLYSCLHCIFFGCKGEHINEHLRTKLHFIALELCYGTLYCYKCKDFIYDEQCLKISEDHLLLEAKSLEKDLDGKERSLDGKLKLPWRPWLEEGITKLQKPKPTYITKYRGLINFGTSCFMNCIMQVLFHTPLLREYFRNGSAEQNNCNRNNPKRDCIVCEFSRLFKEYYSSELHPIPLHHLLYLVWHNSRTLAGHQHHDAHECFMEFLNLLHKHRHEKTDSNKSPCNCIIDKIFHGTLKSDIVCSECNGVSTTIESFMNISLDIVEAQSGGSKLIDCLDRYTRAESLGAKIKCSNCNCEQKGTKQFSVQTLPIVASFLLKRIEYSSDDKKLKKISTYISFPKELDMTPYMSQKQEGCQGDYGYLLYAVVNHSGSPEAGHYTSYIQSIKDVWVKCDDEKIASACTEEVLNSEGYLLFYHKKTYPFDIST